MKKIILVAGLVIGIPIALFFGSAIIAGILNGGAKRAETKPFTGRMKIDHGTEYVLTPEKSHAGGQCEGWSAVAIQAPGDSAGAMKDLMCWRRNGSGIEVNTANGDGRRTDPESVFSD